jgi:exopolysaccharide biosynthesis polyprenyl glycosylphosphotransferase
MAVAFLGATLFYFRGRAELGTLFLEQSFWLLLAFWLYWMLVLYAAGLYIPAVIQSASNTFISSLVAIGLGALGVITASYIAYEPRLGRLWLALTSLQIMILVNLSRRFVRRRPDLLALWALALCSRERFQQVFERLPKTVRSSIRLATFVDPRDLEVISSPEAFEQRFPAIRAVVVDTEFTGDREILNKVRILRDHGITAFSYFTFYEAVYRRVPLDDLGEQGLFQAATGLRGQYNRRFKRLVDVGCGTILLVLALPVMAIAAILVKSTSPGPVLYRQERVGRFCLPFTLYKFRTMRVGAEANGEQWSEANDPRVTRLGRVLRHLRFDELPQLVNVLRGEMSLVGPRPERPGFVEQLERETPFYGERHIVRPGITGWAQVQYNYVGTTEGSLRKLEYDLYYVQHLSPVFDFKIVLRSLRVILLGEHHRSAADSITRVEALAPSSTSQPRSSA